jgi:hypothetical protein
VLITTRHQLARCHVPKLGEPLPKAVPALTAEATPQYRLGVQTQAKGLRQSRCIKLAI